MRWEKSLRLDFRFQNANIVLTSQTPVGIIPPPSDPPELLDDYTGYYVRLTDGDGRIFYVQTLRDPFRSEAETYGDDESSQLDYAILKEPEVEFSILVPDPGFVFTLEIVNNPLQPEIPIYRLARQSFVFTIDPEELILPPMVVSREVEHGAIIGVEKIVDHGPDNKCWTICILAEGYRADEMPKFVSDTLKFIDRFKSFKPFDEFWHRTNVYIVKVSSTDSGADLPAQCQDGAPPVNVNTYFNASFCGAVGNKRLLVVDQRTAKKVWDNMIPQAHVTFAMVNSTIYGGSGGNVPVFSTNGSAALIGIHELGHSFFKLADEYETPYINDNPDNYPNLTSKMQLAQIKWKDLIAPATPIPTSRNFCAGDPFAHPVPDGTVGLFEGGLYQSCNVFRPEKNCLMRTLTKPGFCAVCTRVIRTKLSQLLGPDTPNV